MNEDIKHELVKLMKDALDRTVPDIWFDAFALAAFKVAHGEKYNIDIVNDCKKELINE